MAQIEFYDRGISEGLLQSVLGIVAENITSLSKQKVSKTDPLYGVAKAELIAEVALYLQWVGNPEMDIYLIAAAEQEESHKILVGFMIISAHRNGSKVAGLNYTAVRAENRREGILRQMMDVLTQHFPLIGLSASIENVPVYERLGFYPVGPRGTHVEMKNGDLPKGEMTTVDMDYVSTLPTVQKQKALLRDKYGKKVRDVYTNFSKVQRVEADRVLDYLKSREIGGTQ